MATKRQSGDAQVADFRYESAKRKNNPPAGLAGQGRIAEQPKIRYSYDPHLPPVLRFDQSGKSDRLPDLLQVARDRALTEEEAETLAIALRRHEPWLEWSGKREKKAFEVDPVALHIHERVSAKAILAVAARQEVQRSLFADPQQSYHEAVQFYRHDVDWSNRLILGDSLQVMSSLAKREGLAGQVQMIYMDPPYGIRYASNFQSMIGKSEVKDQPNDLTREPEVIRAYRDAWTLGVHSYLSYLRDRLIAARDLLATSGSVFVQIGEENLHRLRSVMDEVFGVENFLGLIAFVTTGGQSADLLGNVFNFILWYGRDASKVKYRQLFTAKELREGGGWAHSRAEFPDGRRENLGVPEVRRLLDSGVPIRPYSQDGLVSQGATASGSLPFSFQGRDFNLPANSHWKTTYAGMQRLENSGRIEASENSIRYVRFIDDFPVQPITNIWNDTNRPGYVDAKRYAVQTSSKVVERCIQLATDPGDLVLDPTCGSGTTAYVAEQWGRRWIAIDTSRVAVAIARQRILTSTFQQYRTNGDSNDPSAGFMYKTVPHITLKSIAQNVALDSVFARHEPILKEKQAALNAVLSQVPEGVRTKLFGNLVAKEKTAGKKAVSDEDRRRWLLPKERWEEWEIPFELDPDWPPSLQDTLTAYRAAWRAKMDEVNATIAASAEQEELVDQPEVMKGVVRVSGPFTVEAVLPAEVRMDDGTSPIDNLDEDLETFDESGPVAAESEPQNAEAYLDKMVRLLRMDGVRFLGNKQISFDRLERTMDGVIHAEGEWPSDGDSSRRIAVTFGPQYGDITAKQVEDGLRIAARRGFDDIIFAGFSFDASAQAAIQDDPNPNVRAHQTQIRPDVNPGMDGLLKQTPNSQLFTVMGLPRTALAPAEDGQWTITMEGVDIYDPVTNTVHSTGGEKVAAWFLDSDYDGRTFCICQAYFPDKSAWVKLARALKSVIDEDAFSAFSGMTSLPFPAGKHGKVAVKVIDPRGNEVMRVHALTDGAVYG